MTTRAWRVLGGRGCGSAIVEAALVIAGIPYEREECDATTSAGAARLREYNVLAQLPTVVLPDGAALTETAAIVLYLSELVPQAALLPAVGDASRAEALRWLAFFVAAIYPTFTYGDDPTKWSCGDELRRATDAHRQMLWQHLEQVARGPWFLGERSSALDLYIAVMTTWRPRREWLATACPKLTSIARAVDADPRLAAVWAANAG